MIQSWLEKNYGIKVEGNYSIGNHYACKRGDQLYFLINSLHVDHEELAELQTITLHLLSKGDRSVPLFFPTVNGEILSEWENEPACVLVSKERRSKAPLIIGRSLGKFHWRGRSLSYPIKKLSRLGQWKGIWEKRLDQMEAVWNGKIYEPPESEFEKMFFDSFPYYRGLAENAIQYLVDTELDETPGEIDHGTVCHERFTSRTWSDEVLFRNPFEWILDHGSRDLAEWTRHRYFQNTQTYEPDVRQFFSDYKTTTTLTPFSWRLLYARLLFPLHYFECVEEYYMNSSEQNRNTLEDKIQKIVNQSIEYEKFLGRFFQLLEVPVRTNRIPEIDWIKKL